MSKALQTLRDVLFTTGMVQPIESSGRGGTVSVLCRQLPGSEKLWLQVVDALLKTAEEESIDLHVCRRYVRKAGQMVFGWSVGVTAASAKGVVEAVEKLVPVFSSISPLPESPRPVAAAAIPRQVVHGTKARPRAAERFGPDPVPPPRLQVGVRVIRNEVDAQGQRHIIEEMQLPHVYEDINKPKPGSEKGAKYTAG